MGRSRRQRCDRVLVVAVAVLGSVGGGERAAAQGLLVATDSDEYRAALARLPATGDPSLHVSTQVPPQVQRQLEGAFADAVERLRTAPECRGLFATLELEAERALDFTVFYPASPLEEATVCRHSVAFARHGRGPIRLCRRFAALSPQQAAEVVLHEALHRAGLPECHTDPRAETPFEIQLRVVNACSPGGDEVLVAAASAYQHERVVPE